MKPSTPSPANTVGKGALSKHEAPAGYTSKDALANLFTVRYPMAPDTAPEDIPQGPPSLPEPDPEDGGGRRMGQGRKYR